MPRGIPNNTRKTREQETWSADAIHEDYSEVANDDGPLPKRIEARPGFDQRWIRSKIGGEDDPRNLSASFNDGWRRRDPSTIPSNVGAPTIYVEGIGDAIGLSGMILMERPKGLSDAHKKRVQESTRSQMAAVDQTLIDSRPAEPGFGETVRTSKTETHTGSMPVDD